MWIAAIFFWQRLGFYGLLTTTIVMALINILAEYPPAAAGAPLLLSALAFIVLHWGGNRSTWSQMR